MSTQPPANLIQRFDNGGNELARWAVPGIPEGVTVDETGRVYVSMTFLNEVHVFDVNGTFLSKFPTTPYGTGTDVDNFTAGEICLVSIGGSSPQFLSKWDPSGNLLSAVGGVGRAIGVAGGPSGISYVANTSKVKKFDASGNLLGDWSGLDTLPFGVAVDKDGTLYVSGNRITRFGPAPSTNQDPDCSGAAIADQSADANCQATISGADVTGVTDPDGDDLTITVSPATLVLGANTVTVTADDGNGGSCEIDITVNVVDDTPPTLTAVSERVTLWPPNHKYHTISAAQFVAAVSDNCASLSASDVTISRVTSDEPEDVGGGGDGNTSDDIVISGDCSSVDLRAERQGGGNGRVYTIELSVSDGNGNSATATAQVQVPHNKKDTAVDDGEAYGVDCGAPKLTGPAGEVMEEAILPDGYGLEQNHPNPFNPSTTISFVVPEAGEVTLAIYNLTGQLIKTLQTGAVAAGRHSVVWDATDANGAKVASGVYVYQLKAKDFVTSKKLVLTK